MAFLVCPLGKQAHLPYLMKLSEVWGVVFLLGTTHELAGSRSLFLNQTVFHIRIWGLTLSAIFNGILEVFIF